MQGQEFLATYPAKLLEYALGATYLFCFLGFWRYVMGAPVAARLANWFSLPKGLLLHPGHAWARPEQDGLVTVGLDAFASRLLGPVAVHGLPAPGAKVAFGAQAAVASEDGREIPFASPVDGTVVAVNPHAAWSLWGHKPYGDGWLFKVRPANLAQDARRLLSGEGAQRKLDLDWSNLAARLSPQVGAVLQDGGTPVHGIARELEPEKWDALCREFIHP
jgi:glycine cleavage system H lipoate-binding protein